MSNDLAPRHQFISNIVDIITKARTQTYRSINHIIVETYRNIWQMIVEEEQQWNQRAEYGSYLIQELSKRLTNDFGRGFSEQSLQNMRKFFLAFPISSAVRRELTWTHYKILMRIEQTEVRDYYLNDAIERQLSVRQLERQIHTFSYERTLNNQSSQELSQELSNDTLSPKDILKDPYIFEFTGIAQDSIYHETDIEHALISNIESFLLELGKWFTFYARQKHIQTETSDFFIDLVFYNYHLKCFLIIDLKTDKLRHQDIGQIDMYVRMFDEMIKPAEDNPTIWLILCADSDETIVKYSVLNDSQQLFASKYRLYLPTEEELKQQIERQKEFFDYKDL